MSHGFHAPLSLASMLASLSSASINNSCHYRLNNCLLFSLIQLHVAFYGLIIGNHVGELLMLADEPGQMSCWQLKVPKCY